MEKGIVFLTPSLKIGGGNRVFVELANELVRDGYDAEIIYPNNSKEASTFNLNKDVKTLKISNFKDNKLKKLFNLLQTLWFVKNNRKDKIVIVSDPIMAIFSFLLKGLDVHRFMQADDYIIFDDLFLLKNKFVLHIYKKFTKISYGYRFVNYVFNSKFVCDSFIKISKRKDVNFNLVHPGINLSIFFNKNIRKDDELNICLVARKHPWKGFADFIKVWAELKKDKSNKINNIYIISNDDLSGFDISDYTLIKSSNDNEIAEIYNKSHIFISTSWWEGFGLPPLEAMACGCAVILTNAGGVNEYAAPNINCLMYEPRKTSELKEKLMLLIHNKELRTHLFLNALETAKSFSWAKSKNEFLKVLNTNHF
ncbi:glycosyltransferase family 4 protein [Candidatus Methanoperedens nitratireducens]|uniref:Glycosyl transferase family 1 domain-containing protein n=1 Tax=Candidatus Methanoperedens nitratireducens TaxID=1392998 RepID=A0A284VNS0_9EURY|nr:glycosyltransferase family 4 protein [Candidatus Methanoperedens nitroreducens]SNQ60930.1 conserved hypothetical protein [Candidatus Methanoperedens nitroreducens]